MLPKQEEKDPKESWIKVYIRVRPFSSSEMGFDHIISVAQDERTVFLDNQSNYTFKQTFDRAFGEFSQQQDIFEEFQQQQKLVLQGYNFSVIAYGQTGSGKTYTMFGNDWDNVSQQKREKNTKIQHQSTFFEEIANDKNNAGMIPRSIYHLFNLVDEANIKHDQNYHVYCSFAQIYNEKIYDLLVDCDQPTPLPIRESKLEGVFVEGLSEYAVNHYYDCLILMKRGEKNRFIRQTSMNAKSSRSHTIFQLLIESSKVDANGHLQKSKMNLCDLAGSEKVRSQEVFNKAHFNELVSINLSLTTLGKVIQNLSQNTFQKKTMPIPYRESKLTRLLQDSLGGNTQSYFIANVSSSIYHLEETYSTLKFAERAKSIQLKILPNKIDATDSDLVKKLTTEINYLKSLLNMKRSGININDIQFNMIRLQAENNRLKTNNVTVHEVEKLISDNRSMKMEIQMLHQTATLQPYDDKLEYKSENEQKKPIQESVYDKFSSSSLAYVAPSFKSPKQTPSYSSHNLQSTSRFGSKIRNEDSSIFKNGGKMIIKNFDLIPKTEVEVRTKGRNNQYNTKTGFVEQSDRQHNQEQKYKSERQRVMDRLNLLDTLQRENQSRMLLDLSKIESRAKSHNNSKQFDKSEDKEKDKLLIYNNRLKILENDLILNQIK